MKNMILGCLAALAMATGTAQGELILTGVVDGPLSGGTPKAIELYATADIADLSVYGIELVSNAASSAGAIETAFSGSILAGEYYYVATEETNFNSVFGFNPDLTTNDVNHNGDDDLYLYENGVLIDVWGGSDGVDNTGTVADILDSWAYRKDGTGPSATFDASEWTITPTNSLDGLDAAQTGSAVPFGTYNAVPEPSSLVAILACGGLSMLRRRRR